MKRTVYLSLALLVLAGTGTALVMASRPGDGDIPVDVLSVFKKHCVRCHTGPKPPKGLSLIPAKIASAFEAASAEVPEAKLIVPGDPGASYLMKKVRREEGIAGKPMPPGKALAAEEIQVLEGWISNLK
jgi:mono/diheme cytochrome c family protein